MGTWGIYTFENDDAADWLYDLEKSDDLSVIEEALNPEDMDDNYLEAPDGAIIIAACEIMNALLNEPRIEYPENAQKWINDHKQLNVKPLVSKALKMIDRVLADDSELNELWADTDDDYSTWKHDMEDLRQKLAGSA